MYKLYSMQRSGNSYKVRLALALLNAPYRAVEIDILRGESRTPEFLKKNPSGQVPLLEVEPGRYLAESNAILWYVAIGTSLAPEDRIDRAQALQWMFFEQHALEPSVGAAYFWLVLVRGGRDLQTHSLEDWMERGYAALRVRAVLTGDVPDVAEVPGVHDVRVSGRVLECAVTGPVQPLLAALAAVGVEHLTTREPTLEELFLSRYGDGPGGLADAARAGRRTQDVRRDGAA